MTLSPIRFVALMFAVTLTTPLQASIVRLSFSGSLSSAYGAFYIGESLSGNVIYNDMATSVVSSPAFSSYIEPTPFFVAVGNQTFQYIEPTRIAYQDVGGSDTIQFGASDNNTNLTISDLIERNTMTLPSASSLLVGSTQVYVRSPNGYDRGLGNVSITISAVPELTSWTSMIVGFALIGLIHRCRPSIGLAAR